MFPSVDFMDAIMRWLKSRLRHIADGVITMGPQSLNTSLTFIRTDEQAIANDWAAIGRDMRAALVGFRLRSIDEATSHSAQSESRNHR